MKPGKFFVWEGGDKSGKSLQIERTAGWFIGSGYQIITTKEPGGGISEWRSKIFELDPNDPDLAEKELALFEEDRKIHCRDKIFPAIVRGLHVLCDRFMYSTLAYQGYGHGMDLEKIRAANRAAAYQKEADLVILMDIDPEIAKSRITKEDQVNRFESLPMDFHKRVREGYLKEAARDKERWLVVDASQDKNTITKIIIETVKKKLSI